MCEGSRIGGLDGVMCEGVSPLQRSPGVRPGAWSCPSCADPPEGEISECVEVGDRPGRGSVRSSSSKKSTAKTASKPSTAKSDKYKDGIKSMGKNRYEIDRGFLNEQLDDLGALTRQARVIPHYRQGKPKGFKMVGVRPNSLYTHLGLRSGDILKAVNGEEVSSPTKALELYEKLKTSDSVTLEVERRGRQNTFEYNIK